MPLRLASAFGLWVSLAATSAWAAPNPADATVFIRAIGRARAMRGEDARAWREALLDRRNIPIASGTGFIISPQGYVITNLHVVSGEKRMMTVEFTKVEVSVEIERIEVDLTSVAPSQPRTLVATIVASDPDLDLAVLHVNASDLPYAALGDSEAIGPGEAVRVMGFPFGAALEIGREARAGPPQVTITSGNVSALRSNDAGDLRFLQTIAPISPGSSGSPMVDVEGYVLGVAQLKLRGDDNVAFTIPIDVVKGWLQRNGLDSVLPARILAAGPDIESRAKGVRIRPPYGLSDLSPARVRLDSGPGAIALRIDRTLSPWGTEQLEAALLSSGTLESFMSARSDRYPGSPARRILGHASGHDSSGRELKMEYAVVDLGREKIIARYVGDAESVATNRGILHASLVALEVEPLLTGELTRGAEVRWTTVNNAAPGFSEVAVPAEWMVEAGTPSSCEGLPPPTGAMSLSPIGDFSVALRAASWSDAALDAAAAARACSDARGEAGDGSYAMRTDFLGTSFRIEGVFMKRRDGMVQQLEMVAPAEKIDAAKAVFDQWVKRMRQ